MSKLCQNQINVRNVTNLLIADLRLYIRIWSPCSQLRLQLTRNVAQIQAGHPTFKARPELENPLPKQSWDPKDIMPPLPPYLEVISGPSGSRGAQSQQTSYHEKAKPVRVQLRSNHRRKISGRPSAERQKNQVLINPTNGTILPWDLCGRFFRGTILKRL